MFNLRHYAKIYLIITYQKKYVRIKLTRFPQFDDVAHSYTSMNKLDSYIIAKLTMFSPMSVFSNS